MRSSLILLAPAAAILVAAPQGALAQTITQNNAVNIAAVVSVGGPPAQVDQTGKLNYAEVFQFGSAPTSSVDQTGYANNANVVQGGLSPSTAVQQTGARNSTSVQQTGANTYAITKQSGAHNSVSVTQNGSFNFGRATGHSGSH